MPTRIDSLTAEQRDQMHEWTQKWIKIGVSTERADRALFEQAAKKCYEFANIPWHNNVIWVDSPIVASIGGSVAAYLLTLDKDDPKRQDIHLAICDKLSKAVDSCVGNEVREVIHQALSTGFNFSGDMGSVEEVDVNLGTAVREVADDPIVIEKNIRQSLGTWHQVFGGQFELYWYWNSASFSFMREVCKLELPGDLWERSIAFENTVKSACWWYPHERFLIVSERPTAIHLKKLENHRLPHCLHNLSGPAIVWPDGWGVYSVNGVRIPWKQRYIIDNPKQITVEAIESERNSEIRRVMIDQYGPSRYIVDSKAQVIEQLPDDHPIIGLRSATLLRKTVEQDEPIIFIDLLNSTPELDGTTKRYMLRVDPDAYAGDAAKFAHAAAASTWRWPDGSLVYKNWREYTPIAES